MFCYLCQRDIKDCICPDIEERLNKIAQRLDIVTEVCAKCGQHRDRCKCEHPKLQKTGIIKSSN